MAQLLAGGVCHRFRRFDRVHMEGLRTILADTKFVQIIERIRVLRSNDVFEPHWLIQNLSGDREARSVSRHPVFEQKECHG
jgi:hypothetical protein